MAVRSRKQQKSARKNAGQTPPPGRRTIDLHGLTVDEAKNQLLDAIDGCLRDEIDELRVIHGFGTGKVKNAVHEVLRTLRHVKAIRSELGNAGVTVVYF